MLFTSKFCSRNNSISFYGNAKTGHFPIFAQKNIPHYCEKVNIAPTDSIFGTKTGKWIGIPLGNISAASGSPLSL